MATWYFGGNGGATRPEGAARGPRNQVIAVSERTREAVQRNRARRVARRPRRPVPLNPIAVA